MISADRLTKGRVRRRILLVNPNTSETTTLVMAAIARAASPEVDIEAATAPFGAPSILNRAMLATAAEAVVAILAGRTRERLDGVVISAFGDPGLDAARRLVTCPVTGIAEAGMAEAGADDRPFAVATTTPDLKLPIEQAAYDYGHAALFRGVFLTSGDPVSLMADSAALELALAEACRRAVAAGAEAVIIGGGPLASAARALAARLAVPIIEPIPAAMRLAIRRFAS